jgi:hypothetical protein
MVSNLKKYGYYKIMLYMIAEAQNVIKVSKWQWLLY